MAFQYKYLRFTKQAATGSQVVTGVGFTGKALLLWTTGQTAAGATTAAQLAIGMTDGVRQSLRFITHPGAEASTTSAQAEQTDRIAWKSNATSGATPTISVEGEFSAWTSDGFRLNWITNDGAADIYHAIVLGGNIDAYLKQVKITVNSPNTQAVTGVGFQPSSFITMTGAADETGSGDYNLGAPFGSMSGFGFSNAVDNACGWTLGRGTAGAADNYRGQHTDRCVSERVANLVGATELCAIQITSADADGFTLTRTVGTTAQQPVQHILCLRGVRAALGSFTAPVATGNSTLTLPFAPEVLLLQTHGTTASTNTADLGLAVGVWESAGADASGGTWIGGVDAANPSVYRRSTYADLILETRNASTGSVAMQATVVSTSGTGAILNFGTVTGNQEQILYLALASQASIIGSAVFGVKTTVAATRAIAFGLDDNTNKLSEAGKFKVFGDFEVTGTTTLANDSITYSEIQNVAAASRVLGRGSAAGAGDVQELTLGSGLSMAGTVLSASGSGGDVVGPAASVDSEIALFDSTTGKLIKRATGTGFARAASGVYSASKLKRVVGMMIGDGTNVISTGVQGFLSVPIAGTITKVRLLSSDAAATSGSIVIDIWKDTYANYPPTVADTITASAKPTITTATKSEDATLTGWTTSITAGDVLGFKVDSVTSLKRVTVELTVEE